MLTTHATAFTRLLLLLALAFPFTQAGAQSEKDAKPAQDDPPIGKAKFLLYEDFEEVATGQIPKGYQKTGAVAVVEDVSHSGRKSLRMDAAVNGPRRITVRGAAVTALGGQH